MTASVLPVPAKLNLSLHITGKRADGYHLLDSLVAFTEFGDRLDMESAGALTLSITGSFANRLTDSNNLVMKAANLLRERSGVTDGAKIVLHKEIPVGAGLGGGSADAAAALRGLCRIWKLHPDDALLKDIAVSIGSDVSVCFASKPSRVSGVGEQVAPFPLRTSSWVVLVNPGGALLTADVYRRFSGEFSHPSPPLSEIRSLDALEQWMKSTRNDLEEPAIALMPKIGEVLAALRSTPGCRIARMSGSGATCFGLYATKALAEQAAVLVNTPGWWSTATRLQDS